MPWIFPIMPLMLSASSPSSSCVVTGTRAVRSPAPRWLAHTVVQRVGGSDDTAGDDKLGKNQKGHREEADCDVDVAPESGAGNGGPPLGVDRLLCQGEQTVRDLLDSLELTGDLSE